MSNMASLILYIGTFFLSAILMYIGERKKQKLFIVLSLLLPALLAGFRYYVGTDFYIYESMYNSTQNMSILDFLADSKVPLEVAFFFLIKLCSFFTNQSWLFYLSTALITTIFFYLGIRKLNLPNKSLVYLLFLFGMFPMMMNIMRQAAAISILFFSIALMLKGKTKKSILFALLAITFHTSAIFITPILLAASFMRKHPLNRKTIVTVSIISIATSLLFFLIATYGFDVIVEMFGLENKYGAYLEDGDLGENATIMIKLAFLGLFIIFRKQLLYEKPYYSFFLFATIMYTSLGFFGYISNPIKRMGNYLTPFQLIIMSALPSIFNTSTEKKIGKILLAAYLISYFSLSYYVLGHSEIIPYNTIWG